MLIDFLVLRKKHGCLTEDRSGLFPFFSNNNLSIRRRLAEEVGGYDERLLYAEDFDICARVLKAGWILYSSPRIRIGHRPRPSLWETMRQWWNYGSHAARVYKKHHPDTVEVFRSPSTRRVLDDQAQFRKVYYRDGMGFSALIVLHNFWLLHFLIGSLSLAWLAPWQIFPLGVAAATGLSALVYLWPDISAWRSVGFWGAIRMAGVRYMVNLSFTMGGVLSGLRLKSLYFGPYINRRQPRPEELGRTGHE